MLNRFLLNIFYILKPLVPRRIQIFLRSRRCKQIISKGNISWPIDSEAARPRDAWGGWPRDKTFALVLTHDIEKSTGVAKVRQLANLEKRLGFRSCFNFVGADYDVPKDLIDELYSSNFEIGIHGFHHNGLMYATRRIFERHTRGIKQRSKEWKTQGFRSPSMHSNLDWLHALDIKYDSSTFDTDPFEPQPSGTKTIFPFWVAHRDNTTGYVELPYTLPQDFLLFVLLKEKSIDIWKNKLNWIAKNGGMALINTHPDYMNWSASTPTYQNYPVELYIEFLEFIRKQYQEQYWHALPCEVADHYRQTKNSESISIESFHLRSMHICMPTYSFYESDNRVRRYAESLTNQGHTVDVFSLRKEHAPAVETINGVNVFRLQKRNRNERGKWAYFSKLLLFFFKSTFAISFKHLKDKYDLVHVHNIPDFQVFSAFLPKMSGSKVILDIHDIVPELFCSKFQLNERSIYFHILRRLERFSTSFADHVIISNDIWRERIDTRSVAKDKSSVLINYPDPSIFYRRNSNSNGLRDYIIYPGSLNWHQGLDIAIKAFHMIKDQVPNIDFYICGGGPALPDLKELAAKLDVSDRILFKDSLPITEIAEVMSRAKCGIVPKRADFFGNEAFSTKVLEFMALGIPIVLSETDIDRYYFNNAQVLFFRSGDERDLAEKLLLLLTDRKLCERLIHNSLKLVSENNWEKKKHIYFSIINSLMKERLHKELRDTARFCTLGR